MTKLSKKLTIGMTLFVVGLQSSHVFASVEQVKDLPAPGILALVAGGVVAAIAAARLRK